MATLAAGVSRDAGYSYIWFLMDENDRQIVCLLASISTEAAYLHWRQLPSVERIALRSALATVVANHWDDQKRRMPVSVALVEEFPTTLEEPV